MSDHVNDQVSPSGTLPDGTWRLDPSATTVTVTAKNFLFRTVPATLQVDAGSITVEGGAVTGVEISADAGTYDSGNAKRDEHVRSADFLDAEAHPLLTFRCGGVESSAGGYRTDGTVTVKGESFPLAVEISDVEAGPDGGTFVATATVDRKAIGVGKMPSLMIGRDLQLTVRAVATS
ncbi:MAG: YceI family protein [Actinomycetota bacterium]